MREVLGSAYGWGKSKANTFREIQEHISNRVLGWKEKFISKAGQVILIKTVVQAIPTYSMNLFNLPKSLCYNIKSILARYWWGQKKDERKLHWINRQKLCAGKASGGMGFRDINAFNLAMLAKQAWRLIQCTHSLFYRAYKTRYFPNCSFLEAPLGNNPSFVWISLLSARDVITKGSRWRVGDGSLIGVTTHEWLSYDPIFLGQPDTELRMSDLIDNDSRQWDRRKIHALFSQRTSREILAIPPNNLHNRDSLIWMKTKSRTFSVKSACQVAVCLKQ